MGENDQGNYFRYCGQDFWEFLSGDPNLYQEILKVIQNGQSEAFRSAREELLDKMTNEFIRDFCAGDGKVRWDEVLKANSGSRNPN